MNKRKLPNDIKELVTIEVRASFTSDEILEFKNFDKFWETIDGQNAFEEEWQAYKKNGIKGIYKEAYYDLKRALA